MKRMTSFAIALLGSMSVSHTAIAAPTCFEAKMTGAQEVPGVSTFRTGHVSVEFDKGFTKAHVLVSFFGPGQTLLGAHFHCGFAGTNGPVAVGIVNPGPGSFVGRDVATTLTNAAATGADCAPSIGQPVNNIASLAFAAQEGKIYANLHTTGFPSGEVRGQLLPCED